MLLSERAKRTEEGIERLGLDPIGAAQRNQLEKSIINDEEAGRKPQRAELFTWERTDRVADLRTAAKA